MDIVEKLLSRIKVNAVGCFEWQGSKDRRGYGKIVSESRHWKAHRLSYSVFRGDVEGMVICHRCDNPACINPSQLFVGCHRENTWDAKRKNRLASGESNGSSVLTDSLVLKFVEQYKSGMSTVEIAREHGVNRNTVYLALKKLSWQEVERPDCNIGRNAPHYGSRGEKHPRCKVTDEQIETIRLQAAAGRGRKEIAREFGIDPATVSRLVHGKARKQH